MNLEVSKITISLELYKKIRKLYLVEKRSQREIARILPVSRKTIRKYCKGDAIPEVKENIKRNSSLRQTIEPIIIEYIKENKNQHKKQQLNAKIIWEMLCKEKGFKIGQSTVRKYFKEIKAESANIFIPLDFDPGEAMQIDWGEAYAYINNVKRKVSYFCAALNYSKAIHISVYPDKTTESFFMAHIKAFEFFKGVPLQCIYDNLKTAVLKGSGKNAIKQEKFKKLEAHYAFESIFCNVASGWEKGLIENLVKTARKMALTPIPRVKNFAELQDMITNRCVDYCENHKLRYHNESIKEMLKKERQHLLPLPAVPLDPAEIVKARVYSDLTFHYNEIKYSVPAFLVGKKVTLRITPFNIFVYFQGNMIYRHKKAYKSNDHQYIPEHYLELLTRKPRAINNALPLKKGVMPEELITFRNLCCEKDKNYQLVSILQLAKDIDNEKLLWAVNMANQNGRPNFNLVCFYLDIQTEETNNTITNPINVKRVDLKNYDNLMLRGENNNGDK